MTPRPSDAAPVPATPQELRAALDAWMRERVVSVPAANDDAKPATRGADR